MGILLDFGAEKLCSDLQLFCHTMLPSGAM